MGSLCFRCQRCGSKKFIFTQQNRMGKLPHGAACAVCSHPMSVISCFASSQHVQRDYVRFACSHDR